MPLGSLLPHTGGGSGALNLFSREPYAVNSKGEVIGAMLATHAAGVMMAVNRRKEIRVGRREPRPYRSAKGVLMHRFSIDSARGFELRCGSRNTPTHRSGSSLNRSSTSTPADSFSGAV